MIQILASASNTEQFLFSVQCQITYMPCSVDSKTLQMLGSLSWIPSTYPKYIWRRETQNWCRKRSTPSMFLKKRQYYFQRIYEENLYTMKFCEGTLLPRYNRMHAINDRYNEAAVYSSPLTCFSCPSLRSHFLMHISLEPLNNKLSAM